MRSGLLSRTETLEQAENEGRTSYVMRSLPDGTIKRELGVRYSTYVAVLPEACATSEEWLAQLAPELRQGGNRAKVVPHLAKHSAQRPTGLTLASTDERLCLPTCGLGAASYSATRNACTEFDAGQLGLRRLAQIEIESPCEGMPAG